MSNYGFGNATEVLTSNGPGVLPSFQVAPSPTSFSNTYVYARLPSDVINATGNDVDYTAIWTAVVDTGSNYNNSTGEYTVPSTGVYMVTSLFTYYNLTAANTQGVVSIVDSGGSWYTTVSNPGATFAPFNGNWTTQNVSFLRTYNAGDKLTVHLGVHGGAQDISIYGINAPYENSNFCIQRVS